MNNPDKILKAAALVQPRVELDVHYPAIVLLRDKGLAWREIADFLKSHGVDTDHSKVFRMYCRVEQVKAFVVPPMQSYIDALKSLATNGKLNSSAKAMLECHYSAHNRTVTYTQLAQAAHDKAGKALNADTPKVTHKTANLIYGTLGRQLGDAMDMQFAPSDDRGGLFYSSSLGLENPLLPTGAEFQLVMHHELSKALDALGWFNS